MTASSPPAIEDYFLIGDLYSSALVSRDGSVDWLCLPYFDSPSVFARLLDPAGGCFALDTGGYDIACSYMKETAIVERTLTSTSAIIVTRDFMIPRSNDRINSPQYLVRKIIGQEGAGEVTFTFAPRLEYGRVSPEIEAVEGMLEFLIDDARVRLHIPPEAQISETDNNYKITVPINQSEEKSLILEYIPEAQEVEMPFDSEADTRQFWQDWVAKGTYFDFCRDNLVRSAITLKLMQFAPTGAMIAAPTTSLPEEIGGIRNWDYRYVWIRDATFTLYAFYVLGYTEEAERFFSYIYGIMEKCSHEQFDVSLMYTIFGEPVPPEKTLDYMTGYKGSKPVRTGNEAAEQFQLDVYGALIDAYYFANKTGVSENRKERSRELILHLVKKIDETWQKKDSGIWEVRTGTRHFTYSKVMSWVGADRAKRLLEPLSLTEEDLNVCTNLADTIQKWIWEHAYSTAAHNLHQHPGTTAADATNLLFVLLQFLDKHEPVTKEIVARTREELSYQDVFVYRYLADDGLPGKEGAFILCSFWLISALAILEETDEALKLFRKMESLIAPHGLIAEEVDPGSGTYLGNYPQAFSHQGYIMSAHYLHKYMNRNKTASVPAVDNGGAG